MVLTAVEFETEAGYDEITISGSNYSGTSGPTNVPLAAGQSFMRQTVVRHLATLLAHGLLACRHVTRRHVTRRLAVTPLAVTVSHLHHDRLLVVVLGHLRGL